MEEKNTSKKIINIVLCIILFIFITSNLILYNINHGIKEKQVINYIENIELKEIIIKTGIYEKIENKLEIDKDTIDKIIDSEEIKKYITNTLTKTYYALKEKTPLPEKTNEEFIKLINENIEKLEIESNIKITDEQKQKILNLIDEKLLELEQQLKKLSMENIDFNKLNTVLKKTLPNLFIISIIILSILIILINRKNQEFFIYLSAPAIVSGVIILFLTLFIDKGINLLNIDSISFNKLINNFIQISNISSMTTLVIGIIEIIIYLILKMKRRSDIDESRFIQI